MENEYRDKASKNADPFHNKMLVRKLLNINVESLDQWREIVSERENELRRLLGQRLASVFLILGILTAVVSAAWLGVLSEPTLLVAAGALILALWARYRYWDLYSELGRFAINAVKLTHMKDSLLSLKQNLIKEAFDIMIQIEGPGGFVWRFATVRDMEKPTHENSEFYARHAHLVVTDEIRLRIFADSKNHKLTENNVIEYAATIQALQNLCRHYEILNTVQSIQTVA